jgi:hypothetical protein
MQLRSFFFSGVETKKKFGLGNSLVFYVRFCEGVLCVALRRDMRPTAQ